jgi:DNA (cytosine-5)-methyltransferase 1
MRDGEVWTRTVKADYSGNRVTLGDVLEEPDSVPEEYVVSDDQVPVWKYLKGAKNEPRTHKASGAKYFYTEGSLPFPDPLDRPGRTVLTGEGGSAPSRFKHVVQQADGRLRRLVPNELERLNGFPAGWTEGFMTPGQRAFCMGNALVVGIVQRIARVLALEARSRTRRQSGSDEERGLQRSAS